MPRTRNITREQWQAATTSNSNSGSGLSYTDGGGGGGGGSGAGGSGQPYTNVSRSSLINKGVSNGSSTKENHHEYDYGEGEDENENENQENVMPSSQITVKDEVVKGGIEGGLGGRKRKQRPLQDITSLIVPSSNHLEQLELEEPPKKRIKSMPMPIPMYSYVSPMKTRAKGKEKAIEKTREKAKEKGKEREKKKIRFPSSLPPSSPPPPLPLSHSHSYDHRKSSQSQLVGSSSQHQRLHGVDQRLIDAVWASFEEEEELNEDRRRGEDEIQDEVEEDEDEVPVASEGPEEHTRTSDPFGFCAVEKELKAQRQRPPKENDYGYEAGGRILVPSSSEIFPQLILENINVEKGAEEEEEEEEEMISPCATPHRPHKKKHIKRVSTLGAEVEENEIFSPRTESLPSSPSPVKVRESWIHERKKRESLRVGVQEGGDLMSSEIGSESVLQAALTPKLKFPSATKGNRKLEVEAESEKAKSEPQRRQRTRKGKEKAIEPEPEPPKTERKLRPKRGKKKVEEEESRTPSDPVGFANRMVKRLPERRKKESEKEKKITKKKVAVKRKARPKAEEIDLSEQRIEYFKSVAAYSLEEEYVI